MTAHDSPVARLRVPAQEVALVRTDTRVGGTPSQ